MHELSIAMSLIDAATEEAARHPGHITAIHLTLGPLAGVIKQALLSAYSLASETTPLENATLIISETAITAFCPTCKWVQTIPSPQHICCPVCNTPTPDIRSGRELEITALEIQDDPPPHHSHGRSAQASAQAQ